MEVEKDKTTIDPRIRFDLQKNNLTNRSDPEKTLPSRTTDELSSDILPQTLAQRYTTTALGADGEGHCAHALPRSLAHHAKTLGRDTKDSTIPSFDEEFPDMDDELWGLEELITQGQASKGGNDQNIAAENNHEPAPEKRKNTLYSYWSSSPDREQPVTAESPPLLTANPGSSVVEYPFPLLASSPSKGSHSVIAPEVESKVVGKRTLEADEPDIWGHKRPRADQGHNTALQELANAASLQRPQAAQTPVEPVQETPQPPALQGIDPDILAEFCDIVDFY
ncbi:MAG: hypothetical protein M1815_001383 [Lichina confinis]|nr:MAG: hypothetical protein M1815_001383 [Lichina confinis]